MGRRHVELLQEYKARIGRVSKYLFDDCPRFRPVAGAYSPYGILYGFSSHLLEHMALKTLQPDAVTRFSLEDVFVDRENSADKRAWVTGWRKLPHVKTDVEALFEYPQQFAEDIFWRIERALARAHSTVIRAAPFELDACSFCGRTIRRPSRFDGVTDSQSSGPVHRIVGQTARGGAQGGLS